MYVCMNFCVYKFISIFMNCIYIIINRLCSHAYGSVELSRLLQFDTITKKAFRVFTYYAH